MAQQSTHQKIANWWHLGVVRLAHNHTRRGLALRIAAVALLLVLGLGTASQVHRATQLVQAAAKTPPHFTIFLHYDYMVAPDHSDAPDQVGIQLVVNAFKKHNIDLIIDPHHTTIPEHKYIAFDIVANPKCQGPDAVDFLALKKQYFHQTEPVEHYAIFGYYSHVVNIKFCQSNTQFPFGDQYCQTGYGDLPGINFVISLGCNRDAGEDKGPDPYHDFRLLEAGAFMHELGHNLGLGHGGDSSINYKPNYLSVMNYLYETGIPRADSVGSNVPDPALTYLDYSEQVLPTGGNTPGALDPTDLNEPAGLGSGTADIFFYYDATCTQHIAATNGPVDWDGDGSATNLHAAADIRGPLPEEAPCQVPPPHELLTGYDDWKAVRTFLSSYQVPGHGPVIAHILPTSGPIGTTLTITGPNLDSTAPFSVLPRVLFTGMQQWVNPSKVLPDGNLQVIVPSGAKTGPISVYSVNGIATSRRSFTVAPTIITSFSPAHGPYGASVTLAGKALQAAQSVQFGDGTTAKPVTPPTKTTLSVAVPIGARSGPLTVNTPAGPITTDQSFTVDPPTITSFSPTIAPTGSTITILGTDLAEATSVCFVDKICSSGFTINADGSLSFVVPYGVPNPNGPLTVITPVGSGTSTQSFTYPPPAIGDFSPTSGQVSDTVTISGTDFGDLGGVLFTGCAPNDPVSFSVDGAESLTVLVPVCAQTGPITLASSDGSGRTTSDQNFTVTAPPPPSISSFSPASAQVGDEVTISGTLLAPGGIVGSDVITFGGTQTNFNFQANPDGSISVAVPFGATSGPITVTTPLGSTTSDQSFTVIPTPPPVITGLSVTSGLVGSEITISGTNLEPAQSVAPQPVVSFTGAPLPGGTPCQVHFFGANSLDSFIAVVPACAQTGPITVTTFAGSGTSDQNFTVIPTAPPVITDFTPTVGWIAIDGEGSAAIVITGTNLYVLGDDNNTVQFTSVDANPCILQDNPFPDGSRIWVPVPDCAQTGPLTVTTYAGSATTTQALTVVRGAPTISDISPTSGPAGTLITITGTNLQGVTSVNFTCGGLSPSFNPDGSISTVVPNSCQTGPISVYAPYGTATSTQIFTVTS